MLQITTLEQFLDLKNNAVKSKKLKKTNFLIANEEMSLHISNNRVFFEETEKCLCVIIKMQGVDHLYFWCSDKNDVFLPDGTEKIFFNAFTNEQRNDDWSEAAEKLNLKLKSKIYQIVMEVDELTKIRYPQWLDNDYDLVFRENCTYEYYSSLTQPYCEYLDNAIEERYIWDNILKNKTIIAEARTKNDELAAFHSFTLRGKIIDGHLIAVNPDHRGIGLPNFIKKNMTSYNMLLDYKYSKGWIHDWNQNSWRIHAKLGYKKSGNYQAVYEN